MLGIVLIQPEIPGNTGAVGRTCVALDAELILIHPLGFVLSDARVKRSGLDYWPHVKLCEFACWDHFVAERAPRDDPDQPSITSYSGTAAAWAPGAAGRCRKNVPLIR